ncbi:hypothetical protein [Pontibacter aydingkolensis]|uniref:hypothetical protein n=1 Tax=Pontibacter aydingkolensis TaxID=1911536 RepID=UPI001FED1B30|nr:hypothetical protein [Pontibacter aydingkolensis]
MQLTGISIKLTANGVALVVMDLLFLHFVTGKRLSARAALDVMTQGQFFVFFDLGIALRILCLQTIHL